MATIGSIPNVASASASSSSSSLKQPLLVASRGTSGNADNNNNMSSPTRYDGAEEDLNASQAAASTPLPNSPANADSAANADAEANAAPTPRIPQAPRPLWQRRAESCVRGFERRKSKKLRRKEWGICTLAFPNEQQEKVFEWYFAQIRERNMRGAMLCLAFCYMLYATIEWKDTAGYSLTLSRGVYVALIILLFLWSYVKARAFRTYLQEWSFCIAILTSANILAEAVILRAVYSPFVVIILLLFLLSASVIVRLRFVYTSILCWGSLLVYDIICIVRFRNGDDFVGGTADDGGANEVARWAFWYNFVIVFTIVVVQKIAHRVEIQSRYEFLTTMLWTEKRRARRRKRKQAKLDAELQTQYAGAAFSAGGPGAEHMDAEAAESKTNDAAALAGIVPVLVLPAAAAASGAPPRAPPLSDALDDSDSDDSDDDNADDQSDNEDEMLMLAGGSTDDGPVDPGTLARLNASLQKTLHDLLFTPATARQRARIEHEEEEEASFDGHAGSHRTASSGPSHLALSPMVRGMSGGGGGGGGGRRLSNSSGDGNAHMHGQHLSHRGGHSSLAESDSLDAQVPVDQMSRITKALADSGVSDMGAFLRVLASKPQARSKTVFETVGEAELPSWFLAYPSITSGYRVNFSAQLCARSLFKWHNETLNVWSEFIPALVFFVMFWEIMASDSVLLQASDTDRVFVGLGLIGALVFRPICSGCAHLFYPQNERSYVIWWGIDYVSICISIFCTCAVFGRFSFYCLPDQQSFFYVSLVGLLLSTIISVLFVSSNGVRTGSFLLFVLFATGVPFWYTLANKWSGGASNDVPLSYVYLWITSLGCFLVGLVFKSSGFPESMGCACMKPGTFDVFGASHMWWHCLINIGNALVFPVWRSYLQFRHENTC